ncbi:makorin family Zn-finger proteins [Bacillus sp. OxB-1]|nr:makorin family Zn-finger proteins [Bacillus sp. OxB-1]
MYLDVMPIGWKVWKKGGAVIRFFYWNGRRYCWVQDRFLKTGGGSM